MCEEDNEPTGLIVSDGSTSPFDVLGTVVPSCPDRSDGKKDDDHGKGEEHGKGDRDDKDFRCSSPCSMG